MEMKKIMKLFVSAVSVLLACMLCFGAFAEGTDSGAENEAAAEEPVVFETDPEEMVGHRMWGFFVAWCEEDTDRMVGLCSDVWKKAKKDPKQTLLDILGTVKPYGFKIGELRGKQGDPFVTADVTVARETENGGYACTRYEIAFRLDADEIYAIEPDGFALGMPADAVPEGELTLLTQESIIESDMGYHGSRELKDLLVPVNLSVEKKGIRMELISAYAEGKKAWFQISVQDTERKYAGYTLEPYFSGNIDGSSRQGWMSLYHDTEAGKEIFLYDQDLDLEVQPEDRNVTVGINYIRVNKYDSIDLLPLLAQYGGTQEGITPPKLDEHRYPGAPVLPENLKVLDYKQPLDIPLTGNIYLTGIGWIDGQLHVQYHNKGRAAVDMSNGRASACSVWTDATVYGKSYTETNVDYGFLRWDGDNDGWPEWTEEIINCTPEEAGLLSLSAGITVTTEILEGDWDVEIPLNTFCAATGPEAAGGDGNESAAETAGTKTVSRDGSLFLLRDFFKYWNEWNTGSMRQVLADEQRYGGPETEAMIEKLIAGGTPLEYQVNSMTNEGIRERMLTCTVLIDPENGEEPGYKKYQFLMKNNYYVDLGSLVCLGDAEPDPAAETVFLTGEAAIKGELDYNEPGLMEQLLPIGVSCEQDGIRLEVISGLVKEDEAWLLYSVQDVDNKFSGIPFTGWTITDNIAESRGFSQYSIYRDRKEHKVYEIWHPRFEAPVEAGDRTISLNMYNLDYSANGWADLIPLLKQYGETARAVQVPEDMWASGIDPEKKKELKILDYNQPLDIPVLDNASVTGIGWIDGKLHVQIRTVDQSSSGFDFFFFRDGERVSGSRITMNSPWHWYSEGRPMASYWEFVFDFTPEELDGQRLVADMWVGQRLAEGRWSVEFPLSKILPDAK